MLVKVNSATIATIEIVSRRRSVSLGIEIKKPVAPGSYGVNSLSIFANSNGKSIGLVV